MQHFKIKHMAASWLSSQWILQRVFNLHLLLNFGGRNTLELNSSLNSLSLVKFQINYNQR